MKPHPLKQLKRIFQMHKLEWGMGWSREHSPTNYFAIPFFHPKPPSREQVAQLKNSIRAWAAIHGLQVSENLFTITAKAKGESPAFSVTYGEQNTPDRRSLVHAVIEARRENKKGNIGENSLGRRPRITRDDALQNLVDMLIDTPQAKR